MQNFGLVLAMQQELPLGSILFREGGALCHK